MASINAMMGRNISTQQEQQAMARQLRGEQADGDYMSLSTIKPISSLGSAIRKRAVLGAGNVGKVNAATTENARKVHAKTVEDKRKVHAKTVDNKRNVLAKTVENGRKVEAERVNDIDDSKSKKPNLYIDPVTQKNFNVMIDDHGKAWTEGGERIPKGKFDTLERVTTSKSGSGNTGYKRGKGIERVLNGKVISISQDPNNGNRYYVDGKFDEQGAPVEIDYGTTKAVKSLSKVERADLFTTSNTIRVLDRQLGNVPVSAFHRKSDEDNDWAYQSRIRKEFGKEFPFLEKTQWADPESAGWWRDQKAFYEMAIKHDMFGSALSKQEIKNWAEANISPSNTMAQALGAMRDLSHYAKERMVHKLDAYGSGGVPDFETQPFRFDEEEQQKYRDNSKLRADGFNGSTYGELRSMAFARNITVAELVEKLKMLKQAEQAEQAEMVGQAEMSGATNALPMTIGGMQ